MGLDTHFAPTRKRWPRKRMSSGPSFLVDANKPGNQKW
jgi:hypothetical protein